MNYHRKVIEATSKKSLENQLADFLDSSPGIIIHHMTQTSVVYGKEHIVTVIILYTEVQ